jgi:hypothetical protein
MLRRDILYVTFCFCIKFDVLLLCINHNCYLYMPSWGPDLVNKLILISISIRKKCIRMVFCLFCKNNFYPALFTLLYFIILVVATSFWWGTKKIKIKVNNKYSRWNINNCDEQFFYDYSEINQKGPPVRKTWLK